MNRIERNVLAARIYLEAVFPTLELLTKVAPFPIGGVWAFELAAGRQLGTSFRVTDGRVARTDGGKDGEPDFQIDFRSPEGLIRAGTGKMVLPRLTRGWRHPRKVFAVFGALRQLDHVLQGPEDSARARSLLSHREEWLLGIALRGLGIAFREDPIAKSILSAKAPGCARFQIGPGGPGYDLVWDGTAPRVEAMKPGRKVNVEMLFRDRQVARAILRHERDSHAAIALGDIRLTGRIPLAEAIGAILDRLPV